MNKSTRSKDVDHQKTRIDKMRKDVQEERRLDELRQNLVSDQHAVSKPRKNKPRKLTKIGGSSLPPPRASKGGGWRSKGNGRWATENEEITKVEQLSHAMLFDVFSFPNFVRNSA